MGRQFEPSFLLCTFIGALIGAVSSVIVPAANLPNAVKISLPSLSLAALSSTPVASATPDAAWGDGLRDVLRTAMGLARTVTLHEGDTLGDVLVKTGIDRATAFNVVDAIHAVYNPKRFRAGQELALSYEPVEDDDNSTALSQVDFEVDA